MSEVLNKVVRSVVLRGEDVPRHEKESFNEGVVPVRTPRLPYKPRATGIVHACWGCPALSSPPNSPTSTALPRVLNWCCGRYRWWRRRGACATTSARGRRLVGGARLLPRANGFVGNGPRRAGARNHGRGGEVIVWRWQGGAIGTGTGSRFCIR